MINKYTKKSVEIEAVQLINKHVSIYEAIAFIKGLDTSEKVEMGASAAVNKEDIQKVKDDGGLIIHTLEGDMKASFNDYIIKGVNGEFYPCKEDIFNKTYEQSSIVFEIDKYYRHSTGRQIHIISKTQTTVYGECLLGEDMQGSLYPIGMTAENAVNYHEISKDEFMDQFNSALVDAAHPIFSVINR